MIEPYYHDPEGRGRKPHDLERMLRIYFLQQWFSLSDPQAEDAIYDSESMRRFVGVELGEDTVPDETTILRFRHLLEEHGLTEAIFGEVRALLEEKRLLLKSGTIMDATIVHAPSSTKNEKKARGIGISKALGGGRQGRARGLAEQALEWWGMAGFSVSPGGAGRPEKPRWRERHGNRGPKDVGMGGWRQPDARDRGPEEGTES